MVLLPGCVCCGTDPTPDCPPDKTQITAVEVDLSCAGGFYVFSTNGDGVKVFESDLSALTGTYSLTSIGGYIWEYEFPDARADGNYPRLRYDANFDAFRLNYHWPQPTCRSYNGSTYDLFGSCWDSSVTTTLTAMCSRSYPTLLWNSALLMVYSTTFTNNLNAGSGGSSDGRYCDMSNHKIVYWTATGRSGDPDVMIDDLRVYY